MAKHAPDCSMHFEGDMCTCPLSIEVLSKLVGN
jgi:hypothetical protein